MELLKFIDYKDFYYWDVKRFVKKNFKSYYILEKLEEHINIKVKKEEVNRYKDKEIGILGVSNKVGIFDNILENSNNINQSYYKMDENEVAYNPYRINVGSIGIKDKNTKYDYISPAYVVFSLKERILPKFLLLVFKTKTYNKYINDLTTGSVRQNLKKEILNKMLFPIPPLYIQKQLVLDFELNEQNIENLKQNIGELEAKIEMFLLDSLELKFNNKSEFKEGLNFINYIDMENWGIEGLKKEIKISEIKAGKYNTIKMAEIIKSTQFGSSEKLLENKNDYPVLRMNNIQNGELDFENLKYGYFSEEDKKKYRVKYGSILFNRTNSKELVGKSAVFKEKNKIYGYASYLIQVEINDKKANVDYINYILNSIIGRKQIDILSRQVTGQANINSEELKSILIPLPTLEKQSEIVREIELMKKEIKNLKQEIELIRLRCKEKIENSIFMIEENDNENKKN